MGELETDPSMQKERAGAGLGKLVGDLETPHPLPHNVTDAAVERAPEPPKLQDEKIGDVGELDMAPSMRSAGQ
jgi:hypothetical protein